MLAATRLIALHKNKGMTVAACLKNRTDYIENPDKTEQGQYVSSYACSTLTADEEFMLTKRQYDLVNGRRQKSDVIAYQIRQSFRPGEITAEEANKVGYELAMRFTKGKYAFVVATHTDRQHIHNHVIFNSTALDGTRKFRDFFFSASSTDIKLDGIKLAIDCANGATYKAAPMALERLGAEVVAIHREPDGTNINLNCGSTHMEDLCQFVKENDDIQLGIAFDGDGDRCLACDGNGNMVDGDVVMAICAKHMKDNGKLKNNTIVATVMSNMGLFKMGRENGIKVERTKVGDRYVLEHILENGDCFGGEQSGHIIFFDYNTTGDGTLTAIQLLTTLKKQNQTLEEAKKIMEVFPQVLVNARVDNKRKKEYLSNETIKAEIEKLESKFSGEGRVLIRPSGTEPIVRVMIEGRDQSVLKEEAERLARLIEGLLS